MRPAFVLAAAGAAALLLASPGLAGTLGEAAGEALAPFGVHVKCSETDVPGCQAWQQRFQGDENEDHKLVDAAMADGGSTLLLGGSWQPSYWANTDAAIRAVDPGTGQLQWSFTWDSPDHDGDSVTDLFVSPDGSTAYLVGPTDSGFYVHALATDDGDREWTRTVDADRVEDAAYDPDTGWIGVVGYRYYYEDGDYGMNPVVSGVSVEDPTEDWSRDLPLHNDSVEYGWGSGIDVADAGFVTVSATAVDRTRIDVLHPHNGTVASNVSLEKSSYYGSPDLVVGPDGERAVMDPANGLGHALLVDLVDSEVEWSESIPRRPDPVDYWGRVDAPVAWSPDGERIAFGGEAYITRGVAQGGYPENNHGGLVVRDAASGDQVWDRFSEDGGAWRDVAWTDDGAVVAAGTHPSEAGSGGPARASSYDADDGERRWTFQQDDDAYEGTYRTLVAEDETVYAGGWAEVNYWDPWEVVAVDRNADAGPDLGNSP